MRRIRAWLAALLVGPAQHRCLCAECSTIKATAGEDLRRGDLVAFDKRGNAVRVGR